MWLGLIFPTSFLMKKTYGMIHHRENVLPYLIIIHHSDHTVVILFIYIVEYVCKTVQQIHVVIKSLRLTYRLLICFGNVKESSITNEKQPLFRVVRSDCWREIYVWDYKGCVPCKAFTQRCVLLQLLYNIKYNWWTDLKWSRK